MNRTDLNRARDPEHLASVQYGSPDKLRARWNLIDNHTFPRLNIQRHAVERLSLRGDEEILEVGCGEGSLLYWLRAEREHRGRLVGLDLSEKMFAETDAAQRARNLPPIEFQAGSAEALPFPDRSVDVILSFFMLYHMPDIDRALQEWRRVLREDGTLVVATAGDSLFQDLRERMQRVAAAAGASSPPWVPSSFTLENGEAALSRVFEIQEKFVHQSQLRVIDPGPIWEWFHSIRDFVYPAPTDQVWAAALESLRAEVQQEIAAASYYTDQAPRGFFVCGTRPPVRARPIKALKNFVA
jgi:ubiquinone/menaquinone biosynthesis C-methylase UbiE